MTYDIAFVCTGNRYRSVLAEAVFRAAVEGLPIHVESFGTLDIGAAPPLPGALEAARELGLDISRHHARCVRDADLSETDLVIGFELSHAAAAVANAGARPERTFTLLELVELLEHVEARPREDPIDYAVHLIARASSLRASPARPQGSGEIEDPVEQSPSTQQTIGRQVHAVTAELAERLFGARRPSVPVNEPRTRCAGD